MKHLKRLDGRNIRKLGLTKGQELGNGKVTGINVYLTERNTFEFNAGQILWQVEIDNGASASINLQQAFLQLGIYELTEDAKNAENEIISTARGWNRKASEIYFSYDLVNEYFKAVM